MSIWQATPSTPFDLSAGIKLVENAGGSVINLDGGKTVAVEHSGPFIAGINQEHDTTIREILGVFIS